MSKRDWAVTLICGFICMVFVFLFMGSASAVSGISVLPTFQIFGNTIVGNSSGAQTFTVTSEDTDDLVIGTITLTGTNPLQFIKLNDNCSGQTIPTDGTCTVQAVFKPTFAGEKNASLSIPSNAPNPPKLVPLRGTGIVECTGNPCVDEPGDDVRIVRSGSTSPIIFSILGDPFAFPVTKYKLFYRCLGPDFSSWRLIKTGTCNPYAGCPSMYPWSTVPYLPEVEDLCGSCTGNKNGICEPLEDCTLARVCQIKATALANDGRGAVGFGKKFMILPPLFAPPYLYIRPLFNAADAGDSAKYEVFGKEPYTVDVEPSVLRSYVKVNGSSSFSELIGDSIGDDDGICEPGEDCTVITEEIGDSIGDEDWLCETNTCSLDPLVFCSIDADCPTPASLCNVPMKRCSLDPLVYCSIDADCPTPTSLCNLPGEDCNEGVSDPTPFTPLVLIISNDYSCGTTQEATIKVTDSLGATVFATYEIVCP
ncbi:MAG: choice-of-anchor D domain-containing protein [Nitrospirota bacterium]